jgi:pimeloyl-ACP methyl ester carboxylesterase
VIARNGDVRIAWEESGSGWPVLLIHGLGYARWGWEPLVPPLSERYRVISFDNRGIGASSVPPGPYTAAEMASDAVAVLDAAGIDRAHVVGTSLGGMIAQELALGAPDRVDRLVLLSTTPGAATGHPMPTVTVQLFAEAASLPADVALRRFVENALGPEPDPELTERILAHRLAAPQDPAGWAAQAAAGTTFEAGDRVGDLAAPTLVLTGTADNVVDHRNSEVLAGLIPDARLELIEGAGHLVFWERPRQVAELIIGFLG